MQDYEKLKVWRKAHELTLVIYQLTHSFPMDERFGLISQMRRCAASIPSNIAEGSGRGTDRDFARFCQIAMGSACELNYQSLLSHELGYLSDADYHRIDAAINEIQKMLTGLGNSLKPGPVRYNNNSRKPAISSQPTAKRHDPNS